MGIFIYFSYSIIMTMFGIMKNVCCLNATNKAKTKTAGHLTPSMPRSCCYYCRYVANVVVPGWANCNHKQMSMMLEQRNAMNRREREREKTKQKNLHNINTGFQGIVQHWANGVMRTAELIGWVGSLLKQINYQKNQCLCFLLHGAPLFIWCGQSCFPYALLQESEPVHPIDKSWSSKLILMIPNDIINDVGLKVFLHFSHV